MAWGWTEDRDNKQGAGLLVGRAGKQEEAGSEDVSQEPTNGATVLFAS